MKESDSVKSGVIWVAIANYLQLFISFAVIVILSRQLTKEDFGVIALFTLISTFCNIFIDSGISSAVVQKKSLTLRDKQTFSTLSIIFATLFSALVALFGESIKSVLNSQVIGTVFPFLIVNFYLLALLSVPLGLLKRDMKFQTIACGEIIAVLMGASTAILVAYQGYGYWAVVIQMLVYLLVRVIFYSIKARFITERISLTSSTLSFFKNYSSYIISFATFNFWARNADNVLISRHSGEGILGLYSQAYRLMTLPMQLITAVANSVIHPIFSKSIREGNRVCNKYCEMLFYIFILSVPCFMLLLFYPETIISIIWGPGWESSVAYLKILSFLVLFQPALATSGDVFKSSGNSKLLFNVGVLNTTVIVTSMFIGIQWGVKGMCVGYVLSYVFLVTPVTLYYVFKQIGLPSNILKCLKRVIPVIVLLISSLLVVRFLSLSPMLQLIISIFISLLCLVMWYAANRKELFYD